LINDAEKEYQMPLNQLQDIDEERIDKIKETLELFI